MAQKVEKRKKLQDAISKFIQNQSNRLHELAVAHDVSDKQVKDILGLKTHYHKECRVDKYNLEDIQNLVDNDLRYKQLSAKEEQDYIIQLNEYHTLKMSGAHTNNVSAAQDAVAVMDRISKELHALCDQAGIYATVLMVQGHINDQVQSMWIATDNAHKFWEDRMNLVLDDIACQFEEWACNQKKNISEREDLASLQKQAAAIMLSKLCHTTGKWDLTMNYQNYEKAIVLACGVKLDSWPEGLPFLAPSHMHTVLEVRSLRDALVTGAFYWKKLNWLELEQVHTDIQRRSDTGEVIGTVHKKRSDAGKSHKHKVADSATDASVDNNVPDVAKTNGQSKRTHQSHKGKQAERQKRSQPTSAEFIEDSDEEGSNSGPE
ncbi:hypothetical protein EDD22DRAFT_959654 [Suillus occidentalis]|nr:hypothetical protein EDD22DRAFT_959654 [Suillus occidentalis]